MAVGKCVLSVLVRFPLLAAFTQMNPSQTKRQQPDSANSVVCTQTLAITGTSSPALADQKLSTGFSTVDEAFPLSSSSFCLLHPLPFMLTVLAFPFQPVLSICNSCIAVLFPTPLCFLFAVFVLQISRSSFHWFKRHLWWLCAQSRFCKIYKRQICRVKLQLCKQLNRRSDWKTERRWGERILMARKNCWLSRFTSESQSQWLMKGFKGGFKKPGCEGGRGSKRLHKILSENAAKGWGCGILLQWLSNWYFPGMQVLKVNGLVLSDSKAKPPWTSSMEHRLHPCNKIVKLQRTWSVGQCELCFCNTSVERDKRHEMKALSNFSGRIQHRIQQAEIYIGLKKHWGSSERPRVSEVQKLKLSQ